MPAFTMQKWFEKQETYMESGPNLLKKFDFLFIPKISRTGVFDDRAVDVCGCRS